MKLENLTEIFNNSVFRIPDYQRGYSWGKPQLEDLWMDINSLEINKYHYTGALSIKFDKNKNIHYVIDGQQRITTLSILIKVITDKFPNSEWLNGREVSDYIKNFLYKKTGSNGEITEMIFGYEKDNPSHIFFKTEILNLENTDDSTPKDTLYTRNLSSAKVFFQNKIQNLSNKNLELLLKKITENLKFNFYQIEDELNEFVAFETMNNRGKSLSTLELLKNRLIYLSTLLPNSDIEVKNKLRDDVNNAWKTIYEYLGKNPKQIIKDDDFLKNHWIMNFTYDRATSNVYKDFLLKKHFTRDNIIINNDLSSYAMMSDYTAHIQKSVKFYYYIHNPLASDFSSDIKKWLSKLNKLKGFEIFKPLLTVLFVKKVSKDRIYRFLQYAEKFIFVSCYLNHAQVNFQNSHFYGLAKKYNNDKIDIDEILNDKNFYNLELNTSDFISKISKNKQEFYKWKGVSYFLYEYELHLKEEQHGELKIEWENINKDSIEHIYPQSPNNDCWESFQDSSLLNDLGNLLLLSTRDNSKLGNRCFDVKKECFSVNSFSAIEISKCDSWTEQEIINRRNKMFDFIKSRWSVSIDKDKFNNLLDELPKNRHIVKDVKIAELVRSNLDVIVEFCKNHPDELEKLQGKNHSKETFDINYSFFKKLENKNEKIDKFYKASGGIREINGLYFALTTEWFEPSRELFLKYVGSLK